jgi:hypothetical protein
MWIFKYVKCLAVRHIWVGSHTRYCLRCGKWEAVAEGATDAQSSNAVLTT